MTNRNWLGRSRSVWSAPRLAGAFEPPAARESGSKLRALQALREENQLLTRLREARRFALRCSRRRAATLPHCPPARFDLSTFPP
jgi:hypothetical protein